MSGGKRWISARASTVASRLVEGLAPHCERIEVAGSMRRGSSEVGDIEIVVVPKIAADLFGDPMGECQLTRALTDMERDRRVRWRTETHVLPKEPRGARRVYSLVALPEGVPLDIFAVRPPAQWGAIFAIRTGPSSFSARLVSDCRTRGLRCVEGRLVRDADGSTVDTPEEVDFFRECGVQWRAPRDRK